MSSKKRLLWLVILIPLLLIAIPVVLALTVDPNRLKPVLKRAATEQGLDLNVAGDIGWQFYPAIGFSLGEVTVADARAPGSQPLVAVDQASVSVELIPLLKRQILVNGISLRDARVNYLIDATGRSNWDSIANAEGHQQPEPEQQPSGEPPQLEVDRLDLTNLTLNYQNDQTGDRFLVEGIDLQSQNLALDGSEFPIQLRLQAQLEGLPPLALELSGPIALNLNAQHFETRAAQMQIRSGEAQAQVVLTNQTRWSGALQSQGQVQVQPMAIRPWLNALQIQPAVEEGSLGQFSLSAPFNISDTRYELPQLRLKMDDTEIQGQFLAELGEAMTVKGRIEGTRINLDRYLPAPTGTEAAPAQTETPPSPLPLELLRRLNLDLAANFEQITLRQLDFIQPTLKVSGQNGLLSLENLNTQLADGTIQSQGTLDARGAEAQLKLTLNTQGVNLNTVLKTLADIEALQGKAEVTADIASHGLTSDDLAKNLNVTAQAASQEIHLVPINLEQKFCEALSLLQGQPLAKENFEWPNRTEFEPINLQLRLVDQKLSLIDLNARIAKLIGKAEGIFDLETGQFNVPFKLSLGDFGEALPGCLPVQEKWRDFALPIRCKGALDSIGPTTCLPDRELITSMIKDRAKAKVSEKVEKERDRVEDKAEVKAREILQEKLGEERSKAAEESIKGLLKRVKPSKE